MQQIGYIKTGFQKNGKPYSLNKMYVTTLTKNGDENFQLYPGSDKDGYRKLDVFLPYVSPDLIFDVSYTSFATIENQEYIIKAKEIGEEILAIPYGHTSEKEPDVFSLGVLTENKIEEYKMKKTGLLKVILPDFCGVGEYFVVKTASITTINAIQGQLETFSAMLNPHKRASKRFRLSIHQKEIGENTVNYLSLSLADPVNEIMEEANILDTENIVRKNREEGVSRAKKLPKNKEIVFSDTQQTPEDSSEKADIAQYALDKIKERFGESALEKENHGAVKKILWEIASALENDIQKIDRAIAGISMKPTISALFVLKNEVERAMAKKAERKITKKTVKLPESRKETESKQETTDDKEKKAPKKKNITKNLKRNIIATLGSEYTRKCDPAIRELFAKCDYDEKKLIDVLTKLESKDLKSIKAAAASM